MLLNFKCGSQLFLKAMTGKLLEALPCENPELGFPVIRHVCCTSILSPVVAVMLLIVMVDQEGKEDEKT